jgi:hypothetical protein
MIEVARTRVERKRIQAAALQMLLLSACLLSARATAEEPASADLVPKVETPRRYVIRRAPRGGVEDRIQAMAKGLDLDAKQQVELRKLLESQRAQIKRVWADSSMPADDHVNATRAILMRTGDRIRAMLSEEQKKKYFAAATPRDSKVGSPDVEYWMRVTRPRAGDGVGQAF